LVPLLQSFAHLPSLPWYSHAYLTSLPFLHSPCQDLLHLHAAAKKKKKKKKAPAAKVAAKVAKPAKAAKEKAKSKDKAKPKGKAKLKAPKEKATPKKNGIGQFTYGDEKEKSKANENEATTATAAAPPRPKRQKKGTPADADAFLEDEGDGNSIVMNEDEVKAKTKKPRKKKEPKEPVLNADGTLKKKRKKKSEPEEDEEEEEEEPVFMSKLERAIQAQKRKDGDKEGDLDEGEDPDQIPPLTSIEKAWFPPTLLEERYPFRFKRFIAQLSKGISGVDCITFANQQERPVVLEIADGFNTKADVKVGDVVISVNSLDSRSASFNKLMGAISAPQASLYNGWNDAMKMPVSHSTKTEEVVTIAFVRILGPNTAGFLAP
jgi:hypothetical protein